MQTNKNGERTMWIEAELAKMLGSLKQPLVQTYVYKVSVFKYLGEVFDSKLSFDHQIDFAVSKLSRVGKTPTPPYILPAHFGFLRVLRVFWALPGCNGFYWVLWI